MFLLGFCLVSFTADRRPPLGKSTMARLLRRRSHAFAAISLLMLLLFPGALAFVSPKRVEPRLSLPHCMERHVYPRRGRIDVLQSSCRLQASSDDDDDDDLESNSSEDVDGNEDDVTPVVETSTVRIDDGGSDLTDRFKYKVRNYCGSQHLQSGGYEDFERTAVSNSVCVFLLTKVNALMGVFVSA